MAFARMTISIESNFKAVFLVGKAINSFCTMIDFSDIDTYQVELAVVEAVNNVIEHAYEEKTGNTVEIEIVLQECKMTVEICDTGKSLDQTRLAQNKLLPDVDVHDILNLPEGGWGLSIIRQVMDKIVYSTTNGKNKLMLTKCFHPRHI